LEEVLGALEELIIIHYLLTTSAIYELIFKKNSKCGKILV
jgi:hypothetical protein